MGVNFGAGRRGCARRMGQAPARRAAASLILLGLTGGLLATGAGNASARPLARGPAFPTAQGGHLYGIRCTSEADCWAVGDTGANLTEALHWNGHTWSYVTMPGPALGQDPTLHAVDCTSAANCWAVGSDAGGIQALHWNGHQWSAA